MNPLVALPLFLAPTVSPLPASPALVVDEFEDRRAAAAGDVVELWELAEWCAQAGKDKERVLVLQDILAIDADYADAHIALGHVFHDEQWFETDKDLRSYKKKRFKAQTKEAKAKGWVAWNDEWVPPEELSYRMRGLVQDHEGNWVTSEELELIQQGWVRQDLAWIPPEEVPNIGKGLWKCGDEWLGQAEAEAWHSEPGQEWRLRGEHVSVYTTLPRYLGEQAVAHAEGAYADLVRLFGVEPRERPVVQIFTTKEQFDAFSKGNKERRIPGKSVFGFYNVHGAYFADNWFEDGAFVGAGVTYWNVDDESDNRFGTLWIRHALGQSFADRLDPSPETIAELEGRRAGFEYGIDFWNEKVLPPWLRHGAASYAERYYFDAAAAEKGGDPWWTRKWSLQNLANEGGVDETKDVLRGFPRGDRQRESAVWMNQAGLLVAYVLDGEDKNVAKAHAKLIETMRAWIADPEKGEKGLEKAADALAKALEKAEKKVREFGAHPPR